MILSDGVQADIPEGVRTVYVPEDVMESISPMQSPQGALFLCKLPAKAEFQPKPGMLLLDGIQDPGNLGTILRTADALQIPVKFIGVGEQADDLMPFDARSLVDALL